LIISKCHRRICDDPTTADILVAVVAVVVVELHEARYMLQELKLRVEWWWWS